MADITITQVREFIATKLAGDPVISAKDHRDVENKVLDFIVQENAKLARSIEVTLDVFTTNRNYSVPTGLAASAVITSVMVMLVCKTANNSFYVGDVVTAPTPYPRDGGRTSAQGIGVQYNVATSASVKVMVNDEVTIMTAYNAAPGADANYMIFSGSQSANWSIKLIIGYK